MAIDRAIKSSLELRSKKELIEDFLQTINADSNVQDDWQTFVREQQITDLNEVIETEKLKPEATRTFISNAFRDGSIKTTGTDIDRILPPMSRFGGGGNREEKKQTVLDKLKEFFDKYFGLGINSFADDQNVSYEQTEQDVPMAAEEQAEYTADIHSEEK